MTINEDLVMKLINESSDFIYVKELYKIFNLVNIICENDYENNQENLNKIEDEIYTVNGNILTDKERITIDLQKIIRVNQQNTDIKSKELINKKIENIKSLMDEVFDNNLDDNYIMSSIRVVLHDVRNDAIFNIKKRIVVLEAELNIPICFFDAAYESFMDIYKKYNKLIKKGIGG